MQKSDKTNHLRDALKALDSAVDEWNSLTNKALPKQDETFETTPENTKSLLDELSRKLEEFSEARNSLDSSESREPHGDAALSPSTSNPAIVSE